MAKGRKRKQGKRTASGRLVRPADLRIVKPNDRAQAMQAIYGPDGCDAIGRAYRKGLLASDQNEAKMLLDTARSIARAYWAWYVNGPIRSPLADRNGASITNDALREKRQEEWLSEMLARAGRSGSNERRLFDELCININPDEGPAWLDRVIGKKALPSDHGRLSTALRALRRCAGIDDIRPIWQNGDEIDRGALRLEGSA